MKYSIIMPYYKRLDHLHNTLISFIHHYENRDDYEVVIAEDAKNANYMNEHEDLVLLVKEFSEKIKIKHFITETKAYNPAPFYNEAVRVAKGSFLIITNPECFHKSNILNGLDHSFEKDNDIYVVCACQSVNANLNIKKFEDLKYTFHMWYQHSQHRNVMYHFCTAMSKENYEKLGGFDEEFGQGISCEDIDFIERIKKSSMKIVVRDDLLVYHINHVVFNSCAPDNKLWQRNRTILRRKGWLK